MDANRFDTLTRSLHSRRAALGRVFGGGLLVALGFPGTADDMAAAPRCPKVKKRCQKKCIPKRSCCTNPECRRKLGGSVCQRGRCACPANTKRCGTKCIAAAACCQDAECGPSRTCAGGTCQCGTGLEPCNGACVPIGTTCCVATAPELRAALGPNGPATIHLCPDTTYQGTFTINRNVTVLGAGVGSSILDGGGSGPVLKVAESVSAELRRLRIRNGLVGENDEGAGVFNGGTLTLTECAITANRSRGYGGGIFNAGGLTMVECSVANNQSDYQSGGGFYNIGTLTMNASTVSSNQGGGIYSRGGTVTLTETTVSENLGFDGGGINVESAGSLTLTRCSVTGNRATGNGGGGVANWGGTVTVTDSTVTNNDSDRDGGGIYHVSHFQGTAELTLNGCTITGNEATGNGGGIYSFSWDDRFPCKLTLRGETIVTDNDADPTTESGGGIYRAGVGGSIEFFDASSVTGNRPKDCTGVTCPA